ncbi:MAG: LytTR family DNA-binding domain-containing protein [Bacteroidales bacterium]
METLKALIVDDEQEARDILERLLMRAGNVEILGKASGVDEALEMIIQKDPEVVFLDVQMPEKDGFQLVNELKKFNIQTTVIFVTAHIDYAINALKVAAFDYLLKPVVFDELKEALMRFRCEQKQKAYLKKVEILSNMVNSREKICFNTRTGYIYIVPDEIIYCESDVNYTEIHLSKERKEVVTLNLGRVEEIINNNKFHRLGRSFVINTDFLAKADRKTKTCELYKNDERFVIPAPPNQIRILESLISNSKI